MEESKFLAVWCSQFQADRISSFMDVEIASYGVTLPANMDGYRSAIS